METAEEYYINPIYADVISEEDLQQETEVFQPVAFYAEKEYLSEEAAAECIRPQLVEREPEILVSVTCAVEEFDGVAKRIFAIAREHNGNPVNGDYMLGQIGSWKAQISYYIRSGICYADIIYHTINYYTSAEQEKKVDAAVKELLSSLNLEGKSDYKKLEAVYDYVCENVVYDYANLNDNGYYLKYTAYGALVDKTAVCQGYAMLMYRLALELGIDSRFITGYQTSSKGSHGWNIAKINGKYYNIDATWDAVTKDHRYFLKNEEDFDDHTRSENYCTEEFTSAYPIAEKSFDPNAEDSYLAKGFCGAKGNEENVSWSLDKNGVFTISGSGAMADYDDNYGPVTPWFEFKEEITKLVIEEGITYIGEYAFSGCSNITGELEIPEGVTSIGDWAFIDCAGFTGELVLPKKITRVGTQSFYNCSGLSGSLVIPEGVETIGSLAFYGCGIDEFYFEGNAPSLNDASNEFSSFNKDEDILFFNPKKEGWELDEDGKWNGYSVKEWYPDAVENGYCGGEDDGTNLVWVLYDDGRLEIKGEGKMADYASASDAPWFAKRLEIKELYLAEGITSIGNHAFMHCTQIKNDLVIPNSVKTIGDQAFTGCTGLQKNLVLGSSLESIGEMAFDGCRFTGNLTLPENLKTIKSGAFGGCEFTGDLIIPDSVTYLGDSAFIYCSFNGKLKISENIEMIGAGTFSGCDCLTGDIVIPDKVKSIGASAFYACIGFGGNIVMGNSVETIGEAAFWGCDGTNGSVTLPESLKTLDNGAFRYCGINDYYFEGNAPSANESFEKDKDTIHYPARNKTWVIENGKWEGCNAVEIPREAQAKVTIGSGTLVIGNESKISVDITDNSGIYCIQFAIKYDPKLLKVVSCEENETVSEATINYSEEGTIYFVWEGIKEVEGGKLFDITFEAVKGISANKVVLEADMNEEFLFTDDEYHDIDVEVVKGTVDVVEMKYGDVNNDGKVNVIDANLVRRAAAKMVTLTEEQTVAADVDGNGRINVVDANLIRRHAAKIISKFPVESK